MKKLLLCLLLFTSFNLTAQTNNYSLEFDGVDDYVEISHNSALDLTNSVTVSYWLKYNLNSSFQYRYITKKGIAGQNGNLITRLNPNNDCSFLLYDGSTFYSEISQDILNPNQWYYVTNIFNGNKISIYINGLLSSESLQSFSLANNSFPLFIGTDYNQGFFSGNIDEMIIWNTALTEQEIENYMNCPPTGNEAGLVGYWNFEEGAGTTAGDLTSNGNNGTLNGGVTWSTDVPPYNCCTPNPITSQPTNQSTSIGNNATISFTDNLTGATYQWQIDAGTGYSDLSNAGQFSGTDTQTLTISSTTMSNNNTLYRCVVTESSNCMDTTDVSTLTVIDNTSITENGLSNLTIYPNPTQDQITIDIKGYNGVVNVEVYDLQGRLLETTTNTIVSLRNHAKGIYVLKVSYGDVTEEVRVVRE